MTTFKYRNTFTAIPTADLQFDSLIFFDQSRIQINLNFRAKNEKYDFDDFQSLDI